MLSCNLHNYEERYLEKFCVYASTVCVTTLHNIFMIAYSNLHLLGLLKVHKATQSIPRQATWNAVYMALFNNLSSDWT
jgi:hypothetical protein